MLFVIQLADAIKMLIKKEGKLNLKGDHHEDAFLVTVNVDYKINKPQGVLLRLREWLDETMKNEMGLPLAFVMDHALPTTHYTLRITQKNEEKVFKCKEKITFW